MTRQNTFDTYTENRYETKTVAYCLKLPHVLHKHKNVMRTNVADTVS